MADFAITLIMLAGVTVQQDLHGLGQRHSGDFEQQMKVIGHQDIGVQGERVALARLAHQGLESAVVLVVSIDLLALIAPADDVVQRAGKVNTGPTSHDSALP